MREEEHVRVLFTAVPGYGHLLPILPLARAARAAGAEVLVAAHESFRPAVGSLPFTGAGPSTPELVGEALRRYGPAFSDITNFRTQAGLFTDVRVALAHPDVLGVAREFAPDLIVADDWDAVAPLVAAALDVPWVAHGVTRARPAALEEALAEGLAQRSAELGLARVPRLALVDVWPRWLQPEGFVPAQDSVPVRPTPHADETAAASDVHFPGREERPTVLLTLGTIVQDADLVAGALRALAELDVNIVATVPAGVDTRTLDLPAERVSTVAFAPLDQLLRGVSVVVTAGGAGTVLGALDRGLPMALLPVLADQPVIAAAVAGAGLGLVCERPEALTAIVQQLITDTTFAHAARQAAERLTRVDPPTVVWQYLARLAASGATAI